MTPDENLILQTAKISDTVLSATQSLIQYLEGHTSKTEVVNQLESIHTPDVQYVVEALNILHDTLKTHENTDLSGVTALMQELVTQAKLIPKDHAEDTTIDYTKQLDGMKSAIEAVGKVVKAQKLVAEAPIVNVASPTVKVDAPDLAPLQGGFRDVVKAVEQIVIPEYKTDNKAVEKLLADANKLLKKLLDKPTSSGGGGGGSGWTAIGTNGFPAPMNLDASGNLLTNIGSANVTLNASDIEIGAVEIKDGTTDNRTSVINTAPTTEYGLVTRNIPSGTQTVTGSVTTGGLTDTQLRATAVPVSGTFYQATQPVSGTVTISNPTTNPETGLAKDVSIGSLTEAAPATDTASSGLNGRLQRIAQRITSLITAIGSPFQAGGSIGNTSFAATQATGTNLHTVVDSGTVTANAGTNLNTSTLALETGGNLAAIKADVDKIPSQGQALAAASTPVVLTAAQITTLTPPAAITGFATSAKQLPDGHAVAEATKSNLLPYAKILTASDTITPASGKKLEIVWVQVVPNSDNTNSNLVTLTLASIGDLYKVYALGRSAVFTGATDEVLNITLATTEAVSINIQYREI